MIYWTEFYMFNIFPGVETKSTVSDTWSTDVLASDSEPPPEGNQYDRLEELVRSSFLPRQDVRATTDI